jgi:tripartite-type tricarboxylate transporter receptor subunit TctC
MKRRNVLGLLGSAALFAQNARAQDTRAQESWPTKPVKIIVPFGPGGSGDIVSRIVAHEIEAMAGQTFIIENRPTATRSCTARPRASRPIPASTSR